MTKSRKTLLVTGASSGIGRAVVGQLLEQGYHIVGISRSIESAGIKHPNFSALACDLGDFAQLGQRIKPLLKKDASILGCVFCAGVGYFGGLEQSDFAQVQALMAINLLSPMLLSKYLLPHLKHRKAGRLIFIGSEAALQGAKNGSVYCASKFGLRGFVQALSADCRQSGIQVSLINPGMVNSPFFNELPFKPGEQESNFLSAETISECVAYVLRTNSNTLIDEINLSPRNKVVVIKK